MSDNSWMLNIVNNSLSKLEKVVNVKLIGENIIQIRRKDAPSFLVFTLSKEKIDKEYIRQIATSNNNINFIVNIKKEYLISGDCLRYLNSKNISFGGVGDLMRFSNQEDNTLFVDKEFAFVQRGLKQHRAIKNIVQLDNKRIKIERYALKNVIAVMNNDYDFTANSVRTFKERFNQFQVMIVTNPNARVTSDAYNVAKLMNISICKWGDFLGKLNSLWN